MTTLVNYRWKRDRRYNLNCLKSPGVYRWNIYVPFWVHDNIEPVIYEDNDYNPFDYFYINADTQFEKQLVPSGRDEYYYNGRYYQLTNPGGAWGELWRMPEHLYIAERTRAINRVCLLLSSQERFSGRYLWCICFDPFRGYMHYFFPYSSYGNTNKFSGMPVFTDISQYVFNQSEVIEVYPDRRGIFARYEKTRIAEVVFRVAYRGSFVNPQSLDPEIMFAQNDRSFKPLPKDYLDQPCDVLNRCKYRKIQLLYSADYRNSVTYSVCENPTGPGETLHQISRFPTKYEIGDSVQHYDETEGQPVPVQAFKILPSKYCTQRRCSKYVHI